MGLEKVLLSKISKLSGGGSPSNISLSLTGTSLQLKNGTENIGTPITIPTASSSEIASAINTYMTANPVSATVGLGSVGAGEINNFIYNGVIKETLLKNYTYPGTYNTVTTYIVFFNEVISAGQMLSIAFKGTANKKFNVCYYVKSGTTYTRYFYKQVTTPASGEITVYMTEQVTQDNTYIAIEALDGGTINFKAAGNGVLRFDKSAHSEITDYSVLNSSTFMALQSGMTLCLVVKSLTRVFENVVNRAPMPTDMVVVSKTGMGDYTDIQTAINAVADGTKIYVCAGVYNTSIGCTKEIELVGESKHSVIIMNSDNVYANAPVHCSKGKYRNITFYAKCPDTVPSVGNEYACHIDNFKTDGLTEQRVIEFSDCIFKSELNSAIGAGTSYMTTFRFIDCEFVSNKKPALTGTEKGSFYVHGSVNNTNGASQIVELIRCRAITNHATSSHFEGGSDNTLITENCYFWQTNTNTNAVNNSMPLSPRNFGNNNTSLNYTGA